MARGCSVEGCDGKHVAKGFCNRHWKAANRDRVNAQARARYDPDAQRDRNRAYREAHPEVASVAQRRWREANAWRVRSHNAATDARRRAPDAHVEFVDLAAVLAEHGMVCHLCTQPIADEAALHFDHVIPLQVGGAHVATNLRPSHGRCNIAKGARLAAPSERDPLAAEPGDRFGAGRVGRMVQR